MPAHISKLLLQLDVGAESMLPKEGVVIRSSWLLVGRATAGRFSEPVRGIISLRL